MLEAVDVPELRSIRNVILFSTFGSRPEADKLSGSDYDGDLFSITWDPQLFLPSGNSDPMDYTAPAPAPSVLGIEPRHLVEHFVNHAKNDNIGRISNAIIALGDVSAQHQKDPKCIELAALASTAVDFAKSGIPADLTGKRHLLVDRYPHFMGKKNNTYHSDKALGKLYDRVSRYEQNLGELEQGAPAAVGRWIERGRLGVQSESAEVEEALRRVLDPRLDAAFAELLSLPPGTTIRAALESSESAAELWWAARQNREEYERALKEVMNKFRVHCEGRACLRARARDELLRADNGCLASRRAADWLRPQVPPHAEAQVSSRECPSPMPRPALTNLNPLPGSMTLLNSSATR